jgi:hypothetical protein
MEETMVAETLNDTRVGRAQSRPGHLRRFAKMIKSGYENALEMESDSVAIDGRRVRVPQWVVLILVTLLIHAGAGIWWAATISSDMRHEKEIRQEQRRQDEAARAAQDNKVELYRLEIQKNNETIADLRGEIRGRSERGK